MKKLLLVLMMMPFLAFTAITVKAGSSWEDAFYDDFESYEVGKAETQTALTDRWTNDGWNGTNDNATDVFDIATIKSEAGNKYLNLAYDSSFFYMSPVTYRAMEFELEFDVRAHNLDDAWIAVNMRREFRDTRYNGGTGIMFYFRTKYITDTEDNVIGEMLAIQALRGGSLSTTELSELLVGETSVSYLYPTEGAIDPSQKIMDNWYNIKIVVSNTENDNEALYEIYIDDVYKASLTYSRSSLNIYGYFSLNSCLGDFDVDNFSIVSNDTVAPPPKVYVNKLIDQTGTVNEEIALPGGEDGDLLLVGDDDGVAVIEIVDPEQISTTLDAGVYAFTPTKEGIYTVKYIVDSSTGGTSYEEYFIVISSEGTSEPNTTDVVTTQEDLTTTAPINTDDNPSGANMLFIFGGVGVLAIIVAGIVVIPKIKRK